MAQIPLSLLTTIDPVVRETAIFALLVDSPRTVVLRHDIHAAQGHLRRAVITQDGTIEDEHHHLEHACLSCAVREDALPTLRRLATDGRWDDIVLALPVSADSLPVSIALDAATHPGSELDMVRLATVATAVDVDEAEEDLLGIDSVAERGIGLTEDDERAVGEVLAGHLAHADLVVIASSGSTHRGLSARCGDELVDHLRAPDSRRIDGLHELSAHRLTCAEHDALAAQRRCNPLHAHAHSWESAHAWSLELRSDRPLHPERLLDRIEELGTGRVRSRGVFWLPNRPDSICQWDGAGGQLYLGELGVWERQTPHTRLVFTGVARGERARLRAVFDDVLLTDDEIADGGAAWLGREDVLAPWLGERSEAG